MARGYYKIPLTDRDFPLLSEQQTRTIISSGTNRVPPEGERPGIAYCHNVMPHDRGIVSVGYTERISPVPEMVNSSNYIVDTRTIVSEQGVRCQIGWDLNGDSYILMPDGTPWNKLPTPSPDPTLTAFTPENVTLGTVRGITYIFFRYVGCFTFNSVAMELTSVVFDGLDLSTLLGITSAGGYLIAYGTTSIAWSSTILPTDFVPSQVSGAGSASLADIDGNVQFILPFSLGLLVYAKNNVLAGILTGDSTLPFSFRKIDDAKGGVKIDWVGYEANSKIQFAYTRAGLQAISVNEASTIFPEITDFLAGNRLEDFDEDTLLFSITELTKETDSFLKKIKYISSRYLVISYGISEFTHALVYDVALQRLGKLKVTHTDVFEYIGDQSNPSRESLAILAPDGSVKSVNFKLTKEGTGVVMLSKLQFSRSRLFTLLGVELENIEDTSLDYKSYAYSSLDGKNYLPPVAGFTYVNKSLYREDLFKLTGKNISILVIGNFMLSTAMAAYTLNGRM